jgi:GT2 family glycosyltransferase
MVVPTLGRRIELLEQCLDSISRQSTPTSIVIVAPTGIAAVEALASRFNAALVPDPGSLAGAINAGVAHAGSSHEFVNWSGDDDLLEPGSLEATVRALDARSERVLAYGACRYIDADGTELWVSRAGKWAPRILKWGPDLIPQPGMLVRQTAWEQVGGLDESFKFAFDLDLLLKLQVMGKFFDVGQIVSSFRWHGDSLTVGDRSTSLAESERARRRALSPVARRGAWLWERPVRLATRMAANELHRRAARKQEALVTPVSGPSRSSGIG